MRRQPAVPTTPRQAATTDVIRAGDETATRTDTAPGGACQPPLTTRRAFSGAITAIVPPPDVRDALVWSPAHVGYTDAEACIADGIRLEEAGDLHVTLAFLGDADILRATVPPEALAEYLAAAARECDPIPARVAGLGRFTSVPDGAPHVLYASIDAPGLTAIVARFNAALHAAGAIPDDTHGFTPHLTLAYVPASMPTPPVCPPALAWDIREVWLLLASGTPEAAAYTFPLGPEVPTGGTTRAAAPDGTDDTGDDAGDDTDGTGDEGTGSGDSDGPRPPAALIAALMRGYALNGDETRELGKRLYAARVAAFTERLTTTVAVFGARAPTQWTPPQSWLEHEAEQALLAARGIAATYADDLRAAIIRAAQSWYARLGERWPTATQLAGDVARWAQARAAWKAEQVALVETRGASQAATDAAHAAITAARGAADDVAARAHFANSLDEYLGRGAGAEWSLDDLTTTMIAGAQGIVLPDSSSGDACFEWAGETFPLDDYNDVPIPMHYGCIHQKYIIATDTGDVLGGGDE